MTDLTSIETKVASSSNGLTEAKRELIPRSFSIFLDSAVTATGRGTFYNSRKEQEAAVESAHHDLFEVDRDIYTAALLLPGVTDFSRQIGVRRLLQAGSRTDIGLIPGEYELVLVRRLIRELPVQRMLKLFGMLRSERINNSRTRRLILSELLDSDHLEFWTVKYRMKLRVALTHAWGRRTTSILRCVLAKPVTCRSAKELRILHQNIRRFVNADRVVVVEQCVSFILGEESTVTLDRLVAYRDAKTDFDRGAVLPTETMEGLRSRFHRERTSADVLRLTKSQLTSGQKIAIQRKAAEVGVKVAFEPSHYDAVQLYTYAYEMGMSDLIREALSKKAKTVASRLPFRFDRVGILIDSSFSMIGHGSQARRPIATSLALRDILIATAVDADVLTSSGSRSAMLELIQPMGDTSLAQGLVRLLKSDPDAVFVLSDGYENAPAGRFSQVVSAVRRMDVKTPIYQFAPVLAAESRGVRNLSESVVAMPVSKPDSIGLGLLKTLMESNVDAGVEVLFGIANVAGNHSAIAIS